MANVVGRSPVRFLCVVAALFGVVAYGTLSYPPGYLTWPAIHAAASGAAAVGCLVLAAKPSRAWAMIAGVGAVGACMVRAALIWFTLLAEPNRSQEVQVSFVLAGTTWAAMAVVLAECWSWAVVPWVAARGVHNAREP